MGIFDIFNRDKEEEYKGYKLSSDVDVALQKQLIDRGRGNEVNSLTPDAIKKANASIGQVANSTPAMISVGKNSLAPEPIKPIEVIKDTVKTSVDKTLSNPTVQKGLENTAGWLNAVDESSEGLLKRDDGSIIMTQDLPVVQQAAGAVFHTFKNIGRGELGTAESTLNGLQWLGVEKAAPLSDKLAQWQKAVEPENATFADNIGAGIGSATLFFLPGAGVMKASTAIGLYSPRIAALFANSAMTAFEALAEAGDSWKQAKNDGKTDKEANIAGTNTFWANAVLIGLTNKLAYFNKVTGLKKLLISSPMEGLQEFGQQVIQNLSAGKTGKDVFAGALEAGAIGTIIGGILGGADLEIATEPIRVEDNGKEISQVAVPKEFYRLETKDDNKYFQTEAEAQSYATSNATAGTYLITKQGSEEALKVIQDKGLSAFPFEGGLSADQIKINDTIAAIQSNAGVSKSEAADMFGAIRDIVNTEKTNKQEADDIFKAAVDQAKLEAGQTPDIISQAIKMASKDIIPASAEQMPEAVYHQTNEDAEAIKESGFQMGKNSAFGSAAFFGERANKLYGENQVKVSPADFKLKTFKTIQEQQAYIAANGGGKLADAVRAEGKYDGFIIPNPEFGNVFAITNKEKLDDKLKAQQYVTTEEARAMSKSFKFIEELGLPVNVVEKIMTPAGKEAFGKYYKGAISFIQDPHKTTIPHEAVHAFLDLMVTAKQKQTILDEFKRRYAGKNFNNIQAEEQLADDFAKYYLAKFDNAATAKAPSNKIKQFFDWFIEQLKKLVGKGDMIANFYQDIETKKPGILKKEMIRRKLQRINYDLEELQKEYYQNPDALTTKFLENIDVKNREFASYDFLKNLLKSKSLPLKETERNLIDDILDTQFKGEKKINMTDFRDAVRTELLPLQVIESDTYSDYGSENIGLGEQEYEDFDKTTNIYNSPFNHGYTGHFSGDFANGVMRDDVEIKQIPTTNQWAIIKTGIELTQENIAENVYNVFKSQELAEKWLDENTRTSGGLQTVDLGVRGLFGHTRIWKATDNNSPEYGIRYVAEIQSDAFQNLERVTDRPEKYFKMFNSVAEAEAAFDKNDRQVFIIEESGNDEYAVEEKSEIASAFNNNQKVGYEETKPTSKEETNFLGFKNTWHERIIREEIRRAAMEGDKAMRIPTPYTIAKIEGYLSEDGQIPEDTLVGDEFDYMGDSYTLLTDDNQNLGTSGVATRSDNIRGTWDYDTVRSEDVNNTKDEIVYELREADDFNQAVDDNFTLSKYLSNEEVALIKKDYAKNKDLDTNVIDDLIDKAIEGEIDSRYTDNESYAAYYNEMFGEGEETSFPQGDDMVIILEKSETETLAFGTTEKDKETFNYEEDLEQSEHKTVARFYDKQVGRYLAKLRKQNFRIVTDDRGYDWYETDILPEDKSAVEAFQTKPAEAPMRRTGEEVANYVDSIEQEMDEAIPDYLRNVIEKQDFTLKSIKIKQLIARDPDLREYVNAGAQRYPEGEGTDSDLPIVVGSWNDGSYGVLDGFNRTLTKFQNGDEYIEAWVSDTANGLPIEDFKTMVAFIDYARLSNEENVRLEKDARYVAEGLGLNQELNNGNLANRFEAFLNSQPKFQGMTEDQKAYADKLKAERAVKKATFGKVTLKNAMNIVKGIERPIVITKKESILLKNKLRDMARAAKTGAKFGRSEMRADLNLAFAGKLQYAAMIKGAIINYAQELPTELRGAILTTVANAKNISDMAKAFARIDAALKNADNKEQLQQMEKMAKKVKKAMTTGKGIAVDYQKEIADILNDYNLTKPTAATIEKLNKLSAYIADHPEANIPAHLIKRLDILKRQNPKDISGEKLSDLNDLLIRLWNLGELKLKMKGKYDERFIRSSVDKLLLTTRNVDNSTIGGLSLLHAPRVADVFDGFRQYKGYNVALQKKINQAVSQSVMTTKTVVEEAAATIASIKKEFTRQEQAAMAFQMAMDQGLFTQAQALIGAYAGEFGWKSEADIKITPEMQTAIDTLRGTFNSTVDYLAAVYEEIENKPFIKNDNYFPIKYDREFDKKLDIEAPTVNQMADYSSKQINKGFTFARVKGVKKVLRIDIFNVFAEAVAEQQYYMRVQPAINEIGNIVNDGRYQERLGKVGAQWWDLYLKSVANKGKIPNFGVWRHIDPALRAIKINLSNAVLGYKIGSALIQPTAIIDAYSYVYLNHGALAANALIMRLAGTLTLPGYAKGIVNKSLALQLRTGGELTIREMQEQPRGSKLGQAYRKGGMWLLKTMDTLTASAVQQTMYKHFRGKGMTEAQAQTEADFVMNLTQGSSEIADLPLILSSGELARTILTFQTFVLNRWGIMAHDIVRSAIFHGKLDRKLKGLIALFLISMAGGLEAILRKQATILTTGKDYPEKFNFWQQSLLTAPETVPVVGSILTSVLEYNKGFSLPITRVVENLISGAKGLIDPAGETNSKREENRTKGALKLAEAAATFYGIAGTSQIADFMERALVPPTSGKSAGGSNNNLLPEPPKPPKLPAPPKLPKPPMR